MTSIRSISRAPAAAVLAACCWCAVAAAQPTVPTDTEGIGITENLGEQVPLDLQFTDEDGRPVTLADYFNEGKPVMLTLVYYACPGICNALLNGLTQTLGDMQWSAGDQFQVVTVSIDPTETPDLAGAKKRSYLAFYERPTAETGWRFLVGEQSQITALADAVGFGYRYEERTGLYTHAASLMICTPDGRLSRYLTDVIFEPETVQLALTEASTGAVGSPMQRFLLKWCYTYDPSAGKYVVAARKVMVFGGALFVPLMAAGLVVLWRHDLKRRRLQTSQLQPARAPSRGVLGDPLT